ncbi:hypothetical protein D3Z52_18360 [Clostridiaceae bacterium]|nr:hypothetical protein [Clostridiaceae bacterium]
MLEIRKNETSAPFTASARQAILEDIPPEQICFVLRQLELFYQKCDRLSLPVNNQIAFLDAIRQRFSISGQRSSFGCLAEEYFPLMLLYSSCGNLLFCVGDRSASDMARIVKALLQSVDVTELRTKVREQQFKPLIMQQASHDVIRKAFADGAEFFYWEELNRDFAAIKADERNTAPLKVTGDFFCPEKRSISLLELFEDYYIAKENIPPDTAEEQQILELRERLLCAVRIRELHLDYLSVQAEVDRPVLQDYTRKLLALLTQYPAGLASSKQLQQLWEYYEKRDDEACFDKINVEQLNKSKGRPAVRNAALILLSMGIYQGRLEPLREQLEELLQGYLMDPLYCFFTELFKNLELYPNFQPFAPVYVWRLFVHYANRLSRIKNSMFNGKNPVDFSWTPVFSDKQSEILSEENRSQWQYGASCDLFGNLIEFFEQEELPYPIDKPMCEYLFQRLTRTELDTYSNTSVFGIPLRNPKPLYRGFELVRNALSHTADDLWMDMPRSADFPVPAEEAANFYQDNYRHGIEAMQHLFEHKKGRAQKSRKVLSVEDYTEIVRIALLPSETPEEEREQRLSVWMRDYINHDPKLRKYADESETAYGNLQFSIYRLALERFTHYLARDIFDQCEEMFYYPLPQRVVSDIWSAYFIASPECWKLKKESDPIYIRDLKFPGRNLYFLYATDVTGSKRRAEKITRFFGYPCTLILPEELLADSQMLLNSPRQARILFKPSMLFIDAINAETDYLSSLRKAANSGYDGIKIHGLRMDAINFTVLSLGTSLNNYADSINEDELIALCQTVLSPIYHLADQIRMGIGDILPLIFTLHIPADMTKSVSLILRVLCRYLSDSGVDAIELVPLDMMPAQKMMEIVDDLNASIPIPILIGKDYLTGDPSRLLSKHAVTGFVTHYISYRG